MNTNAELKTDIAIVGAGPVGLAMACMLARGGLEVILVDAGPEPLPLQALENRAVFAVDRQQHRPPLPAQGEHQRAGDDQRLFCRRLAGRSAWRP